MTDAAEGCKKCVAQWAFILRPIFVMIWLLAIGRSAVGVPA
jgi:hypothetical protein